VRDVLRALFKVVEEAKKGGASGLVHDPKRAAWQP
jgi:hypothetical protein